MEGSREQAFDAFCAAQHDQLVRAVHLVCGDLGIAEELAQTALERAWARWDQVAGMASPGGWVQTVAFNLARSGLRRRAAERRAYARHGRAEPNAVGDLTAVIAVREALAKLPARQREVVVHRFHAGRSAAETAVLMGITTDAVTQLAYRARQRLREQLDDEVRPARRPAVGGPAIATEEDTHDG